MTINTGRVKVGDKFTRLLVIELVPDRSNPKAKCICDCGNITLTARSQLKNGRAKSCGCLKKELLNTYAKNRVKLPPEEVKKRSTARTLKWQRENKEKYSARSKRFAEKNKEKLKEYREKNKEHKKKYDVEYRNKNKERLAPMRRVNDHKRRIREINGKGNVSKNIVEKLMVLQKGCCAICRCDITKTKNEIDHITPLALGGDHDDKNFQLLCQFCNRSKGAKDPVIYMQQKGFLI